MKTAALIAQKGTISFSVVSKCRRQDKKQRNCHTVKRLENTSIGAEVTRRDSIFILPVKRNPGLVKC
jgi:hypothetical protein